MAINGIHLFGSGVLTVFVCLGVWAALDSGPLGLDSQSRPNLQERVLMVTGSQPSKCSVPNGDHLLLRLFKNKVDYCRRHGYRIFYNMADLNPNLTGSWSKIQTIRSAMKAHPDYEWIFWIESDAVFTDMDFNLPLHRYRNYNLVSINPRVFLIRNCQWAVGFLDKWAEMGHQTAQLAMSYMLTEERHIWGDKTYIENDYSILHGVGWRLNNISRGMTWRRHAEVVAEHYRELWAPRSGKRPPFVTHFTGCRYCEGDNSRDYEGSTCQDEMRMALNFADDQMLKNYGLVHRSSMDDEVELIETSSSSAGDESSEK